MAKLPILNDITKKTVVMFTEHYQSRFCGTFTVVNSYLYYGTANNSAAFQPHTMYDIKFDYSGFVLCTVAMKEIRTGAVKDPYYPLIYSVANNYRREYQTWKDMLRRCYDVTNRAYRWYGAKGTYVCDRWLCFEFFLYDFIRLPNYELWLNNKGKYQLDKDIIPYQLGIMDNKCYCPEYCCLATRANNMAQQSLDHADRQTSKYLGVCMVHNSTSYQASIIKDNIEYKCGVYSNEIAAANARNRMAMKLYGNDIILNDVPYMNFQNFMQYSTSKDKNKISKMMRTEMCKIIEKEDNTNG